MHAVELHVTKKFKFVHTFILFVVHAVESHVSEFIENGALQYLTSV